MARSGPTRRRASRSSARSFTRSSKVGTVPFFHPRRWGIFGENEVAMQEEQLRAYLTHKMPQAEDLSISSINRIPGGASRETWAFDAHWREAGQEVERGFIVRRDPSASVLETERDVEFGVYQAVAGTGVPVPPVYWLETDP